MQEGMTWQIFSKSENLREKQKVFFLRENLSEVGE